MLPHNIQRSDTQEESIPHYYYFIFKFAIALLFPACLLESSWLTGSYNNVIIYCGLKHTTVQNTIVQYDTLCETQDWSCQLRDVSYVTWVSLVIYYTLFISYTFAFLLRMYSKVVGVYMKKVPEIAISSPLFLLLYTTLLYYANSIPHKFENTLVEFDSSFGVAFICCMFHMCDTLLTLLRMYKTPLEIHKYLQDNINSLTRIPALQRVTVGVLTTQITMGIPLFMKPDNFVIQNIIPLFGIYWIYNPSHNLLLYTYVQLTCLNIFINTFKMSMMKQTQYETASEIIVNVFFVIDFVLQIISILLIGIMNYTKNDIPEQSHTEPKKTPSLKKHIHTIQAARDLTTLHKKEEDDEKHTSGRFTIT